MWVMLHRDYNDVTWFLHVVVHWLIIHTPLNKIDPYTKPSVWHSEFPNWVISHLFNILLHVDGFFFRSERVLYFFYPEIVYNRQNWVLGGTENFVIPLKEMYNDFYIASIRSTFFLICCQFGLFFTLLTYDGGFYLPLQ